MKKLIYSFSILLSLIINSSFAEGPAAATPASPVMDKIKDFMNGPSGMIFAISGVATIYSKVLYSAADKQEADSNANVKKLEKLIASFKDSYAGYCPNGRESLNDPKCYCYTDAGKQNTNRNNSKICTDLWAKNNVALNLDNTDYNSKTYNADVAGCVTVDGQFDENCRCKKLIDAKGKNACQKSTSVTIPNDSFNMGFATGGGLKNVLQYAADAGNGNPRFDLVEGSGLTTNAIDKTNRMNDQLLTKVPTDVKLPKIDEKNVDKFAGAILGEDAVRAALASTGGGMAMNVSSSRSNSAAVENILKEAQIKAGLDLTGGNGLAAVKDAKKAGGLNFNFAGDNGPAGGNQVLADFPETQEKTYKFKNSDIATNNSASIFEIISNRYIQSGLKRLFDDEAK